MGSSDVIRNRWWWIVTGLVATLAVLVPLLVLGGQPKSPPFTESGVPPFVRSSVQSPPLWTLFPAHLASKIDVVSSSTVIVRSVVTNHTHVDGRAECSFNLQIADGVSVSAAGAPSGGRNSFITNRIRPGESLRINQYFINGNVNRVVDASVAGPYPRLVRIVQNRLYCFPMFSVSTWAYEHPGVREPQFASLVSVSCAAIDSCMAIGYRYVAHEPKFIAERWNGHEWKVVYASATQQLTGVSCPTPNWCMPYGESFVLAWSPGQVTAHTPPLNGLQVNSVSCVGPRRCVLVGKYAIGNQRESLELSWNGSRWSMMPPLASDQELTSVSCTSSVSCMGIGIEGTRYASPISELWNGRTWTSLSVPTIGRYVPPTCNPRAMGCQSFGKYPAVLELVSCGSSSSCFAIGTQGLAEAWTGGQWAVVKAPAHLVAVSCFAVAACEAVGFEGIAGQEPTSYGWNGSRWLANSPSLRTLTGGATFSAISCLSQDAACVAVGKVVVYPVSGPNFLVLSGLHTSGGWDLRT